MTINFRDPLETLRNRTANAEALGLRLNKLKVAMEFLKDIRCDVQFLDRQGNGVLRDADLRAALKFGFEIMIGQANGELDLLLRGLGLLDKPSPSNPKEIED